MTCGQTEWQVRGQENPNTKRDKKYKEAGKGEGAVQFGAQNNSIHVLLFNERPA